MSCWQCCWACSSGGQPFSWTQSHQSLVSTLTTVAVFFIVYPMMINLKLEALVQAGKNVRGLSLSVLYNFLWAPLVGLQSHLALFSTRAAAGASAFCS